MGISNVKNKKRNKIIAIILLILLVMVVTLTLKLYSKDDGVVSYNSAQEDTSDIDNTIPDNNLQNQNPYKQPDQSESTLDNSNNTDNSSDQLGNIQISASTVASNLVITTKLDGISDKDTTQGCNLSIKSSSQEIIKQAEIIYQPDFSTCAGFSIPTQEINETGVLTITLVVGSTSNTITYNLSL